MSGYCSNCDAYHEIIEGFFARATLAVAAGFIGLATGNPIVAMLLVALGMWIGGEIDRWLARRCPECRTALLVIATLV